MANRHDGKGPYRCPVSEHSAGRRADASAIEIYRQMHVQPKISCFCPEKRLAEGFLPASATASYSSHRQARIAVMEFVEEIVWMGQPLSYIIRRELSPTSTVFLTPAEFTQQLGFVVYPAGG